MGRMEWEGKYAMKRDGAKWQMEGMEGMDEMGLYGLEDERKERESTE